MCLKRQERLEWSKQGGEREEGKLERERRQVLWASWAAVKPPKAVGGAGFQAGRVLIALGVTRTAWLFAIPGLWQVGEQL